MPSARCTFLITRRYFFNFISTQARFSYSLRSSCFHVKHTHTYTFSFVFQGWACSPSKQTLWKQQQQVSYTSEFTPLTPMQRTRSFLTWFTLPTHLANVCAGNWFLHLTKLPLNILITYNMRRFGIAVTRWSRSTRLSRWQKHQVLLLAVKTEFSTTQGCRRQTIWKVKQSK